MGYKKVIAFLLIVLSLNAFSQNSDSLITIQISRASYNTMIANQAMLDAKVNYRPRSGTAWKVGLCSALGSPILGAIPAITYSSKIPSDTEINYPQTEIAKNAEYRAHYLQQVQKTKKNKILVGYIAGGCTFVIGIGIFAAIVSISSTPMDLNLY